MNFALWTRVVLLAVSFLVTACASETLFRSNFDPTPVGQPPAAAQDVGTAFVDGPAGSVVVIAPPVSPSGKWLRISRPNGPAVAGMQGKFAEFRGEGRYTVSATMFMPKGSKVATLQFETFTNAPSSLQSFMHIDLTEGNQIRIDDKEETKFGAFPRDKPFIVEVRLDIGASSTTAHVALAGADAMGEADYTIAGPFQNLSRQFGAVRAWQGFPHTGEFDVTNIVVTRRTD